MIVAKRYLKHNLQTTIKFLNYDLKYASKYSL